MKGIDQTFA